MSANCSITLPSLLSLRDSPNPKPKELKEELERKIKRIQDAEENVEAALKGLRGKQEEANSLMVADKLEWLEKDILSAFKSPNVAVPASVTGAKTTLEWLATALETLSKLSSGVEGGGGEGERGAKRRAHKFSVRYENHTHLYLHTRCTPSLPPQ
jgi:hypothetical protein